MLYKNNLEATMYFRQLIQDVRNLLYTLNQFTDPRRPFISEDGRIEIHNLTMYGILPHLNTMAQEYSRMGLLVDTVFVDKTSSNPIEFRFTNPPPQRETYFVFLFVGHVNYLHAVPMIMRVHRNEVVSALLIDYNQHNLFKIDQGTGQAIARRFAQIYGLRQTGGTSFTYFNPQVDLQEHEPSLFSLRVMSIVGLCQLWTISMFYIFRYAVRDSTFEGDVMPRFMRYLGKYSRSTPGIKVSIESHITIFMFIKLILEQMLKNEDLEEYIGIPSFTRGMDFSKMDNQDAHMTRSWGENILTL